MAKIIKTILRLLQFCFKVIAFFVLFMIICFVIIRIFDNNTTEECLKRCLENGYDETDCINNRCDFPI